jgi:chitinase
VSLLPAATGTVFVGYGTSDATATGGADYVAAVGVVSFSPGQTSKTINVSVNGDTMVEANETFNVRLTSVTKGTTLADPQGIGTILNDDGLGSSTGGRSDTSGLDPATSGPRE